MARRRQRLKFDQKLVLFQWMLGLFEVHSFEELASELRSPTLEGFDEEGISRYCHVLRARLFDRERLSADMLLAYDENIVRHWRRITDRRNADGYPLYPKYFQYLALLFTEIYLDRYFRDCQGLLADLNAHVDGFNADKAEADRVLPYAVGDLNKVAFWAATGSGKTLLMHVNILQYRHYLELHGRQRDLNRIILLTPNEGLSIQHLGEFALSDMRADLFSKDGAPSLFSGRDIEIIDIHKLREEAGEKTVAVEAFEGNNLVLVDEGHRGASAAEQGHWMRRRNQLCENGFSFEYSATFGQAVRAANSAELETTYTRCTIFDYSYKYFYNDGYGKDYHILNLADDRDEQFRTRYLTACLLAFYQQQKLYRDKESEFRRFLIEKPLWVFVGSSVNAVRTENRRQVSDVVDILLFLAGFVTGRAESIVRIQEILAGHAEIRDERGHDIFAGRFTYIGTLGLTAEQVFDDIVAVLFNADSTAALHVENRKGSEGEIALRLGENVPFGVINVGDASKLCKLCEDHRELVVTEQEFSGSLFQGINDDDSSINVLIGSKKFSEGWSSWRVSTMGLMNVGRSEGSQIIQLFGRGVRLKGLDFCLKRSRAILGIRAPAEIERIETLNIFGIRADYMRQFKEYLEEEGLPSSDERIEIVLPVIKNLGTKKLKTIRLQEGVDFKRNGPRPTLDVPDDKMGRHRIVLDWYPKIQAMASVRGDQLGEETSPHVEHFRTEHLAFLDYDALYFEMQRFKNERAWHNLNLPRGRIRALLADNTWYEIHIPHDEFAVASFEQVHRWQEIALGLLKKYCDRFYKTRKAEYENDFLEYVELTEDDPNFVEQYVLQIEQSRRDIVAALQRIKKLIEDGALRDATFDRLEVNDLPGFQSLTFVRHLYQPLLYASAGTIDVRPVVLENQGERDFVLDLREYCHGHPDFLRRKELYLLRNLSRGRGIGFFEAGGFHPDFIVWLLADNRQHISFVDPKGLRSIGLQDEKIQFYRKIKEIEERLRRQDPSVVLNSFIISSTPYVQVSRLWGMRKRDLEDCHVLFQEEDRGTYIETILNRSMAGEPCA